jgi:hypothetical protein
MKKPYSYLAMAGVAVGLLAWQSGVAEGHDPSFPYYIDAPVVFQAAGPTAASIQSSSPM